MKRAQTMNFNCCYVYLVLTNNSSFYNLIANVSAQYSITLFFGSSGLQAGAWITNSANMMDFRRLKSSSVSVPVYINMLLLKNAQFKYMFGGVSIDWTFQLFNRI